MSYIDPNSGRAPQPGSAYPGAAPGTLVSIAAEEAEAQEDEQARDPGPAQTPVVVEADDQAAATNPGPASDEESEEEPGDDEEAGDEYDPADYNVDQVLAFVADHPDLKDDVLASEKAGKNRTTLVSALEASDE